MSVCVCICVYAYYYRLLHILDCEGSTHDTGDSRYQLNAHWLLPRPMYDSRPRHKSKQHSFTHHDKVHIEYPMNHSVV